MDVAFMMQKFKLSIIVFESLISITKGVCVFFPRTCPLRRLLSVMLQALFNGKI